MSTYTSEPGTRLAGRYRLVDQMTGGTGWTLWKAMDETLARPVSVLTFAPGFPRIPQVVTAARAASRLTDPRLAQVFDVEDGPGGAYIVLEWVGGESLTDLLTEGPLDPARACALVADAARALSGAHAAGQAHLCLTPEALRWTRSSGIKITGLGIDAALAGDGLTGAAGYDPAVADTMALGALLYAALTGYWPGELPSHLPPAPASEGGVATPRQVSANVSAPLDALVCRALLQRTVRQGPPIQSPAAFADALASAAPPVPLPEPAPPTPSRGFQGRPGRDGYGGYPNPNDPDTWQLSDRGRGGTAAYPPPSSPFPADRYTGGQYPAGGQYPPNQGQYGGNQYGGNERGGASRVMLAVVVVLVLAVVAATVWAVGLRKSGGHSSANGGSHPTASHSATPTGTVLTPVGDSTFNPYGHPPGNTENQATAANAIDGDPNSSWQTSYYFDHANFAGLKPGTGLLIDMGKSVRLSQVEVTFGKGDTTAEIYLGNSNDISKTALQNNFTLVSPSATVTGDHVFKTTGSATGQYVLIWITNLPPMINPPKNTSHTYFQALIYNVVIRGTADAAAG
jgi:serine/threonine protein kinase